MMRATAIRLQPLLRRPLVAATAIRSPAVLGCSPARRFATLPADESDRSRSGIADQDLDRQSSRLSKAPTQGIPPSPFDREPVGDHSGDAASGVKEQLGKLSEKAKSIGRKTKRTIVTLAQTPVPEAADHSSRLHTRASSSAPPRDGDSVLEDLKDDARRIKQKVSNKMKKVGLSAESAGVEMKDKGEDMWVKTKKAARRAKDNLKETVEEAASTASTATTVQPERELFDVEDLESESEPVRAAAQSEELSTTAGRDRAGTFTVWEPKDDLNESPPGSAGSIGLKQESVKKSMLDGPQEMPQGVGKRAHDEAGRPLETGTERS